MLIFQINVRLQTEQLSSSTVADRAELVLFFSYWQPAAVAVVAGHGADLQTPSQL